ENLGFGGAGGGIEHLVGVRQPNPFVALHPVRLLLPSGQLSHVPRPSACHNWPVDAVQMRSPVSGWNRCTTPSGCLRSSTVWAGLTGVRASERATICTSGPAWV